MTRRLAVVTHYWAPHVGGIETVAREQAQRLAGAGWQAEVFTSRLGADPAEHRDGAVRVHRYRCVNWPERALIVPVPLPSPRMAADLRRAAARADAVLVHGHCYPSSALGARAARAARRPLVVLQHSPFVGYPFPLEAVERGADALIGRRVLHQARVVVCVSAHVAAYVTAIAPQARTRVIYSGVDTARFRPDGPAPRHRGLRVLTVRRLVPRNGVHVLVEAWRRALPGLPAGSELVVAGSGPELARLRQRAAGLASVSFPGYVPDAELPGRYRAADVCALPSVSGEGFGVVAAEALACGTPVVATTGGATGELVRDGADGLIVAAGDVPALAAALTRLGRDPGLRDALAAAARARGPGLGWDAAIRTLAQTLDTAAGGPAPAAGDPAPAAGGPARVPFRDFERTTDL